MKNQNLLQVVLAVGLILVSLFAVYTLTEKETSERNTISVSGSSTLDVVPDQAEVYLRIETLSSTPEEAQDKNTARSSKVIETLRANGLKNEQIETINYNLEIFREWDDKKYVDRGYKASHTLKLTINDLEKVGYLIKLAVDNGANNVENVAFALSKGKEKEVRSELLSNAASDARNKADSLADSLDLDVEGVVSVSESAPYVPPYYYLAKDMEAFSTEAPQIQPKSVSVSIVVNVVFKI